MYHCLVSVTAEARMTAGTRDAKLMEKDAGLWMKSAKDGRAPFFLPSRFEDWSRRATLYWLLL